MKKQLAVLLFTGTVLPVSLFALGIRVPDQDPFATARGEAFVATADNPSAIYYNPAGLTQLEGHNFRAGAYVISLGSEFTGFGVKAETKDEIQPVPQLYYAFVPQSMPFAFGLGFYSPYGLNLEWPDTTPFRMLARKGRITYLTLNPVAAWKISDSLSLAAGPTFNIADAELQQGIAVPGDGFKFKGDDHDIGFNAGLRWQPHEKHAFGASYRSETRMNFQGSADTSLLPPVTPAPFAFSESASAGLRFPQHVIVGYSFRPTPAWNLEFNADWTDWDRVDTVTLQKASGNAFLPLNWTSSLFYEFGVTYYFANDWRLSGGYIYSENSVPDASFNPTIPDSDRHIFSVGVGRKYKSGWNWDLTYQYAHGPTRTINNTIATPVGAFPSPVNGDYRYTSHAFAFSIGYGF